MSSENQDWLSAASDNRAISQTQLNTLLKDQSVQSQLERYQLIGAVIRNEKQSVLPQQFSADFSALLEQEPQYKLNTDRSLLQKVTAGFKQAANTSWFRTGAQGGVAAAVALFAVFGVQQYQLVAQNDASLPAPILQTAPIAGFATPVSLSQTTVDSRFEQQQQQAIAEQQKHLQMLLNAHRQQVRVMDSAQHQADTEKKTDPEREQ